jgi:hypothetical protein
MTRELGSGEARLLVDSAGKSGPSQSLPSAAGRGTFFSFSLEEQKNGNGSIKGKKDKKKMGENTGKESGKGWQNYSAALS